MGLTSSIQRLIIKCSVAVLASSLLLWFSIFSYGLLYYLYIPAIAHSKPVHLIYDTVCSKDNHCRNPYANISLTEKSDYELLTRGQVYAIELVLNMPESENNLDQGMFMVRLDMLSGNGMVLQSSIRPARLRYRSPLFKVIYTLFYIPALLVGTTEEKQTLTITLFEQFLEYKPIYYVYIEIEARVAEVYSSILKIHAHFTGLRYMMYYWPLLSMAIGVGSIFFILITVALYFWIRQELSSSIINSALSDDIDLASVNEIRSALLTERLESQNIRNVGIRRYRDTTTNLPEVETISPHKSRVSSTQESSVVPDPPLTCELSSSESELQASDSHPVSEQFPTSDTGIRRRAAIPE